MTCPICAYPGHDVAAVRCVNCGFAMRPPPPNPAPYPDQDQDQDQDTPAQYPTGAHPQLQPVCVPPVPGPQYGGYRQRQYQPQPPRRRSRVVVPLTVIAVVLVVVGTVITVVRMGGGATFTPAAVTIGTAPTGGVTPSDPPPRTGPAGAGPAGTGTARTDPAARSQAAAVDAVLGASVASRRKLNDAIALVSNCTRLKQAVGAMRSVGTERDAQLAGVAAVDLSALPEGEQARSLLSEALRDSLAADRSFVLWGQARRSSGCDGRGRADYDEAQRQSTLAGDAKARFLTVWNPVAARNGLHERDSSQI